MEAKRDILIVGGGIFGAAIAFRLARQGQGHRVRIVERHTPACGATSRAAALVTQIRDDVAQLRLAQETLRTIAELEAEGVDVGRHAVGALHVSSAAATAPLRQRAAAAAALDVRSQRLDAAESARRAPWLRQQAIDGAVLFPDDGFVDPWLLTSAYLGAALRGGVALMQQAEVSQVLHEGGRVRGVELRDGQRLDARWVVIAAGAWSNLLSVELGLPLPMAAVRSQYWISETAPIFPRDGAVVLIPEIRAYARPELGALLFGVRERTPAVVDARRLPADLSGFVFDPADPDGWDNLAAGAEALERFFPALRTLGIAHYITGPSNYTDDGQLLLGRSPAIEGLLVATGCNGSGITFSGGVGRLLAELILGQTPFLAPEQFNPARRGAFDPFAPAFLAACAATRAGKSAG